MTKFPLRLSAVVLLVAAVPEVATATERTMINSGDINVGTNWSPTGTPGAGDRAVVPDGFNCTIPASTTWTTDTLNIHLGGSLKIMDGATLILQNDNVNLGGSGPDHSEIDGVITIAPSSTSNAVLRFENANHVFDGDGSVAFKAGQIQIEAGVTFTNSLLVSGLGIYGPIDIQGDEDASVDPPVWGHFNNLGRVEVAAGNGRIGEHTLVTDNSDALWVIDNGNCGLDFEWYSGSLTLEGDFVQEAGGCSLLAFYATVKTCGTYVRNDGGIEADSARGFGYLTFDAGSGSCGNPGTYSTWPVSCTFPYWVLYDVSECCSCP